MRRRRHILQPNLPCRLQQRLQMVARNHLALERQAGIRVQGSDRDGPRRSAERRETENSAPQPPWWQRRGRSTAWNDFSHETCEVNDPSIKGTRDGGDCPGGLVHARSPRPANTCVYKMCAPAALLIASLAALVTPEHEVRDIVSKLAPPSPPLNQKVLRRETSLGVVVPSVLPFVLPRSFFFARYAAPLLPAER